MTITTSNTEYFDALKELEMGNYKKSIISFNKLLSEKPDDITSLYQKSIALGHIGEYDQQIQDLEIILSAEPENKNALMSLASYYHDFQDYISEMRIIETLLNIYHNDPEALFNKAICSSFIYKKAFNEFYSDNINPKNDPNLLAIKGSVEFNFGRLDNAINLYKTSLKLEKNIDNYHFLAFIYYQKGELNEARKYLNKCLESNPNHIPSLLLFSSLEIENIEKSNLYLEKVLNINPNHFTALSCKAWLILEDENSKLGVKEYKEAEYYVDLALKLIPEDPDMLKLKAVCSCFFGNYDESCDYYKKALSINPFDENLYTGAAITLSSKTNYQKALDYCEKAEELNPDYTFPIYYKGQIMSLMGEYSKAIELYEEYLRLEKNDISALLSKSESLIYLKRYEDALKTVGEAINLDKKRIGSWITKGKIYHYYLNDLQEAIEIYKYALENVEEDPEVYYYLKNALKSLGNIEDSRYYENKLIESDIIALEKQLEDKLVKDLSIFEKCGFNLKLLKRQYVCSNFDGNKRRIDLLCENLKDKLVIIELKVVKAGIETFNQIDEYIKIIQSENPKKEILGIVISDGTDDEFLELISKENNLYHFNISDLGFETMF